MSLRSSCKLKTKHRLRAQKPFFHRRHFDMPQQQSTGVTSKCKCQCYTFSTYWHTSKGPEPLSVLLVTPVFFLLCEKGPYGPQSNQEKNISENTCGGALWVFRDFDFPLSKTLRIKQNWKFTHCQSGSYWKLGWNFVVHRTLLKLYNKAVWEHSPEQLNWTGTCFET